ncbi:capsule assembly Wzi family protein [Pedobacter sp.]|uniref:capsule assembly Wzi family protein n=1 Tax=Pedobacter sp. TaxID=1411316 RepID=UPI003D7FDF1B
MINKSVVTLAYISSLTVCLAFLCTSTTKGQYAPVKLEIETQIIGTTNHAVPFWMRSNQFGSIPLPGGSGSFIGRAYRNYDETKYSLKKKTFDWGFGFEGRVNAGTGSNLTLIESFVKVRASIFQIKAGRTKDVTGLNGDTTLSSGNFAVAGNALGVPKIELSIPKYFSLPIFGGLLSFKGNFAHGWLGNTTILDKVNLGRNGTINTYDRNPSTYLHQKSLYVRLGKKSWRLQLYGGANHQVFWGNERAAYGDLFDLSTLSTFFYVLRGKTYRHNPIPHSKIGNQLGSIDLGAEYQFNNISISLYRQSIYETGALSKLANIKDGLNGITLANLKYKESNSDFRWKKILVEFFYSKDQAGYPWSKPTQSGDEDYYNNYYYPQGWSYQGEGLGNPLITTAPYANDDLAAAPSKYFSNNRVIAVHSGFTGSYKTFDFLIKATYSKNYGTFATSKYGESTGSNRSRPYWGLFTPVQQYSIYVDAGKALRNNYYLSVSGAVDQGKLLPNSWGLQLKLKKEFN